MSYDVLTPAAARLWPYSPDWSAGFSVRRAWKTDIFESRDVTEQRRAIRQTPRLSVEYRTTLQGTDLRGANHWLRAWQNKPAIVPHFARYALTTGSSIAGSSSLTVSPMPSWVGEGQTLMLCGADDTETALVASVAGTTITLEDPLANAWPSGSVVRPTFHGLFDGRISTRRLHSGAAEINVSADSYPGSEPPIVDGTPWATLGTREIFTLDPDFRGSSNIGELWPVEQIDVGRGWTAQFRPQTMQQRLIEADFNALGTATAVELEQFFDRMKGRRNGFYLPTGEKDFVLNASAGSGSTTFVSTGRDIADDFGTVDFAAEEMGVAVFLTDGSRIYRRISDIALTGSDTLVTMTAALGTAISTANVARISWMPVARFGSDEMEMLWSTPLAAGARLSFQTVRR